MAEFPTVILDLSKIISDQSGIYRHILFDIHVLIPYPRGWHPRHHRHPYHSLAECSIMIYELSQRRIVGPTGNLLIPPDDQITPRLLMLIEGECEGLGPMQAAQKHGLSRQRYYQLYKQFQERGFLGLQNQKRGPKTNSVRTEEVERQIIRHRFLDPDASVDIIAQKLRQAGFAVSTRSVERVVEKYGLQKKTLSLPPQP
jgi:transposase